MADKYSIDDILKELDSSRSEKPKNRGARRESVTDIIGGGDEIDRLIKTQSAGRQQKRDLSVTEVINSIPGKQRPPVRSARQRTESETEKRIAADVSKAADNKRPLPKKQDDVVEYAARQLSEDETETRIARDVSKAADIKRWEDLRSSYAVDRVYDEDFREDEDDVKTYSPGADGSAEPAEAEEAPESDDIVLHDADAFVPSETMELRRMKKIGEIQSAMLKLDSEAESPDEMLASINPMESREKAEEQLKNDEDTDTLAVSGNELKSLGRGEERIKEYTPSASRKRDRAEEEQPRQKPFTGELHVGESIIDALNKKINEQSAELEMPFEKPIEIGADNEAADEQDDEYAENSELDKIKQANELAQKKKRRISEFILDHHEDTEETERVDEVRLSEAESDIDAEDDEAPVDLNDEEVIRDRLRRASKGLWGRLIILGILFIASVFVGAINIYRLDAGRIGRMLSYRGSPENYLYFHLITGVLSFAACSSVISNGFSRLFKLRPDGDTLCALAHMGALVATIPYLASGEYIQRGFSQIYLAVSLAALIFNTVSKLLTVKTAQRNFDFVFGRDSKYYIELCESGGAGQLAKGTANGVPVVAATRKTEMLCDFIVSTYCEDSSDRTSRRIVPVALGAALVGGIIAYFTCSATITRNHASWAATVSSAILAVSASFSGSMTVTLPMYFASRKAKTRGSAILGYAAAEELSDVDAVLCDAKMLFPAGTIKIVNICGYDTPKTRGEGKINIDEAIIYAASLAVASDSVMSDALFSMLNYKREMLKPVSGCVYENNLGVMGWIDRRRVLLGSRAHMKAHEITVPNTKKEAAANKNNDEVIYLAVGGEVCLLFFVKPLADPDIRRSIRELTFRDISVVIKTVDGMVTAPVLAKVFRIDEEKIKILPYEQHETFDENTRFVSSGSAAITSDGTFTSLSKSIIYSRAIRDKAAIGNIMQLVGIAVAYVTMIIFTLLSNEDQLKNFNLFNLFHILLYSTGWGALTLALQLIRRT